MLPSLWLHESLGDFGFEVNSYSFRFPANIGSVSLIHYHLSVKGGVEDGQTPFDITLATLSPFIYLCTMFQTCNTSTLTFNLFAEVTTKPLHVIPEVTPEVSAQLRRFSLPPLPC